MKQTFVLLNDENIPRGVFNFNLGEDITERVLLCIEEGYDCSAYTETIEIGEFDYEIYFDVRVEFDREDYYTEQFKLISTANY
jgi:hypothetical protein